MDTRFSPIDAATPAAPPVEHWVNGDRVTVADVTTVEAALDAICDGDVVSLSQVSFAELRAAAFRDLVDLDPVLVTVRPALVTGEESQEPIETFLGVRQGRPGSAATALAAAAAEILGGLER